MRIRFVVTMGTVAAVAAVVWVASVPVAGQAAKAPASAEASAGKPAASVNDPATWTRPWTFAMVLSKTDVTQQPFEYACHKGHYGLRTILSAARAREAAAKKK